MRTALAVVAFLCGAALLWGVSVPQEGASGVSLRDSDGYGERVTVRRHGHGWFAGEVRGVPACRREVLGRLAFYTLESSDAARPAVGSEIIDGAGTAFVVEEVARGSVYTVSYVRKAGAAGAQR